MCVYVCVAKLIFFFFIFSLGGGAKRAPPRGASQFGNKKEKSGKIYENRIKK